MTCEKKYGVLVRTTLTAMPTKVTVFKQNMAFILIDSSVERQHHNQDFLFYFYFISNVSLNRSLVCFCRSSWAAWGLISTYLQ